MVMWARTDTRFPHTISADGANPAEQAVRYWLSGHAFVHRICLLLIKADMN